MSLSSTIQPREPIYARGEATDASRQLMTDTQTTPSFPAPILNSIAESPHSTSHRIQLPPLKIPPNASNAGRIANNSRACTAFNPTLSLSVFPHPPTRTGPVAPLDKLLSPFPHDSERTEPLFSPRSPARSANSIGGYGLHRRVTNDEWVYERSYSPVRMQRSISSQGLYHRSQEATSNSHQNGRMYHSASIPSSQLPLPPHIPNHSQFASQHGHNPIPAPTPDPSRDIPPPPRLLAQPPRYPSNGYSKCDGMAHSAISEIRCKLKIRQQPIAARACGLGERDRRVIDPPPIIQLTVSDSQGRQLELDELNYSINVVHCTLWNAEGTHEEAALKHDGRRAMRRLMGQLVASPSVAKDEHDNEGCFFCFPDLSCRSFGQYRLRFVLMRIDPANLVVGGTSPVVAEVLSDVFTVYTAKEFPGMRPSSALTRALKIQGCNIQVKKGNDRTLKRSFIDTPDVDAGGGKRLRL